MMLGWTSPSMSDCFFAAPPIADLPLTMSFGLTSRTILDGDSTVEVIVDRMPAFAGIDPYNKLIDRNSNDNLLRVGMLGTTGQRR